MTCRLCETPDHCNGKGACCFPMIGHPEHTDDCICPDHEGPCRAAADKTAMEQHIVLDLYRREDGGLRIAGRGDARGLILSEATPAFAIEKIWPALFALKHPITQHDY